MSLAIYASFFLAKVGKASKKVLAYRFTLVLTLNGRIFDGRRKCSRLIIFARNFQLNSQRRKKIDFMQNCDKKKTMTKVLTVKPLIALLAGL